MTTCSQGFSDSPRYDFKSFTKPRMAINQIQSVYWPHTQRTTIINGATYHSITHRQSKQSKKDFRLPVPVNS